MEQDNNELQNDKNFVCVNCNQMVIPYGLLTRNHCPNCLFSLHTDIFPNDNANPCHGKMRPIGTLQTQDEEMLVVHKCESCGKTARAKIELDDNYEVILKLLPSNE